MTMTMTFEKINTEAITKSEATAAYMVIGSEGTNFCSVVTASKAKTKTGWVPSDEIASAYVSYLEEGNDPIKGNFASRKACAEAVYAVIEKWQATKSEVKEEAPEARESRLEAPPFTHVVTNADGKSYSGFCIDYCENCSSEMEAANAVTVTSSAVNQWLKQDQLKVVDTRPAQSGYSESAGIVTCSNCWDFESDTQKETAEVVEVVTPKVQKEDPTQKKAAAKPSKEEKQAAKEAAQKEKQTAKEAAQKEKEGQEAAEKAAANKAEVERIQGIAVSMKAAFETFSEQITSLVSDEERSLLDNVGDAEEFCKSFIGNNKALRKELMNATSCKSPNRKKGLSYNKQEFMLTMMSLEEGTTLEQLTECWSRIGGEENKRSVFKGYLRQLSVGRIERQRGEAIEVIELDDNTFRFDPEVLTEANKVWFDKIQSEISPLILKKVAEDCKDC